MAVEKETMIQHFMETLADEKICQNCPEKVRVVISVMRVHFKDDPHIISALEVFCKSGHSRSAYENLKLLVQ